MKLLKKLRKAMQRTAIDQIEGQSLKLVQPQTNPIEG